MGHELGVKKSWKKKRNPRANSLSVDENINLWSGGEHPQN
jgi:hypothetical protein